MAEQKDSSVLFSLKELMNLEEDRIRQEEDARRRAADEAVRAQQDAERKAREAEEARLNAMEERRRQEDLRSREEQAKLEAIRQAEIERARLDAENQARIEAMRQQQQHQLQLAAVTEDKKKKTLTMIAVGAGVLLVLLLAGGGYAIKVQQDKQFATAQAAEAERAALQAKIDDLNRQAREQSEEVDKLKGAVANAKNDSDRQAAEARLREAEARRSATMKTLGNVRAAPASGGAPKPPTKKCAPGDPLCSDLN